MNISNEKKRLPDNKALKDKLTVSLGTNAFKDCAKYSLSHWNKKQMHLYKTLQALTSWEEENLED
jgi:hypothetical protein